MKQVITFLVIVTTALASAQDQYTQGMEKAFQLWEDQKSIEASNMFERVAAVEIDNWLPYYYVAQVNTIMSFGERDIEKLTLQLEKAQEYIDLAKAISPDNPEILVQQAMIYTAWIVYDGATYGMKFSGKVAQNYQKALALAPDNPRVVFSKAEWDIGSAAFFGQDTAPFCKEVARSIDLFANFKPASEFHPNWGKERAMSTFQNCNK